MEENLKRLLSQAIEDFNGKRSVILQLAYKEGGLEAVNRLEKDYDALRGKYFEILKRQLDKSNAQYRQLINAANLETEKLRRSISQLESINEIINLTAVVVSLVGRVLIILGI